MFQEKKLKEPENIYERMDDRELFEELRNALLYAKTGIRLEELLVTNDPEKFTGQVNQYISRLYKISPERIRAFDEYILRYIFGFHVLTELMEDREVTDIKVLGWDNVRIKRLGKRMCTHVKFWSESDFKSFVEMVAIKNGINTGTLNAIQTFTDKTSSEAFIYRFNITNAYINSTEAPYLHIRKIPKQKRTLEGLIKDGMLTPKMAGYIKKRISAGYMVICGANGTGKTYLLNALLDQIPAEESGLVVQENEELFSEVHPDMMFQHIAGKRGDKMSYSLKELVINGLLMDIDHIVIGEIKGGEAMYFITAALAGCSGITTIHSASAEGAMEKLADYCKWESDYSRSEIMKLLGCVKTIVFVDDFKIRQIAVNHGWEEEKNHNRIELVYDREKGVDKL